MPVLPRGASLARSPSWLCPTKQRAGHIPVRGISTFSSHSGSEESDSTAVMPLGTEAILCRDMRIEDMDSVILLDRESYGGEGLWTRNAYEQEMSSERSRVLVCLCMCVCVSVCMYVCMYESYGGEGLWTRNAYEQEMLSERSHVLVYLCMCVCMYV
jgi:hypothetical protein